MVSESEDEYDAFIECIEDALQIKDEEPIPEPVEAHNWENVPISPFGPQAREMKIQGLRRYDWGELAGVSVLLSHHCHIMSLSCDNHAHVTW
jgi:hypothetical protein